MSALWNVIKQQIGDYVDSKLDLFASWAVARSAVGGKTLDPQTVKEHDDPRKMIAYVISDYVTGEPYITRVRFPTIFGVRPLLHHIHRADHDRDMHDHPFEWSASFILRGEYDEERPVACHHHDCTCTKSRRVRWFNFIRGTDVHRITELHGDVWTLFLSGPRTKGWGFREWDPGFERWQMTPSSDYIARRKVENAMSDQALFAEDPTYDLQVALSDYIAARKAEQIEVATGNDLDRIGALYNLSRYSCDDCSKIANLITPCEPDEVYRERIVDRARSPK